MPSRRDRPPRALAALVFAAALAASSATAEEGAGKAHDFLFGVGTHFAFTPKRGYQPATQAPHLAELGVDSLRDDVDEEAFVGASPARPLGTRLDRLNSMVADRTTARPVLILRSRRLASQPAPRYVPTNDKEYAVFARYAVRVVRATRSFDPFYELWNEWNVGWRQRPALGGLLGPGKENPLLAPENYVGAARAAYGAIKAADPSAFVLTGAIGEDGNWEWTRRALAAGLLQSGDGVSVHLYNHCNPPAKRTAEDLIGRTEAFAAIVRGGDRKLPIYVTEFGWPNDTGPCGIPRDLAAANVAQYALWASTVDWIGGVWAYELRDSGQRPDDREDNFGLYDYGDRPKPAACAYREAIGLVRQTTGRRFLEAPDGTRWLEGRGPDGEILWAFWTTARNSRAMLALAGGTAPLPMRTLCSERSAAPATEREFGMMPLVVEARDAAPDGVRIQLR